MSLSKVWRPEAFPDDSFGFTRSRSRSLRFRIRQVFDDKRKVDATIVRAGLPMENIFYALFDKNEVDFEIGIENRSGWRVSCDITVGNSFSSFILDDGLKASMKALRSGGKQLHFISQKTDDGKLLVAMKAKMNGTSYEEEAVKCSRIKFRFSVEHEPTEEEMRREERARKKAAKESAKEDKFRRRHLDRVSRERPMTVSVETLPDKTLSLDVFGDYSIETVKSIIHSMEGIPSDQQRLIFHGKQLEEGRRLSDYQVKDGDIIHLVLRLRGGGCFPTHLVSERGVVCFGQDTDQRFGTYKGHFVSSEIHSLESLTLELRTKPVFSFAP